MPKPILILSVIVGILTVILFFVWKYSNRNIVTFDGSKMEELQSSQIPKGDPGVVSFDILFKSLPRDGILFFSQNPDKSFRILYVYQGRLHLNMNNNPGSSLIVGPELKPNHWYTFDIVMNELVTDQSLMYFGNAPEDKIPTNQIIFEGHQVAIPFPKEGLVACLNNVYVNGLNVSKIFQERGLRNAC